MAQANGVRKTAATKKAVPAKPKTKRKPTLTNTIKKRTMLKQLELTLGIVTEACKLANVDRSTYYDWLKNDPKFKEAVEAIPDKALDVVEGKLFERINGYSHPEDKIFMHEGKPVIVATTKHYAPDTTAMIFYLKTKGKGRGYIERTENMELQANPLEGLTDEELQAVIDKHEKILKNAAGKH